MKARRPFLVGGENNGKNLRCAAPPAAAQPSPPRRHEQHCQWQQRCIASKSAFREGLSRCGAAEAANFQRRPHPTAARARALARSEGVAVLVLVLEREEVDEAAPARG